jgi:hypothetical protein
MEKLLAACGLECAECDAYKATQTGDVELAKKVAAEWTKAFGGGKHVFAVEETYCDGCLTPGERKGGYCGACPIRACVIQKKIDNCAHCADYACKDLTEFFNMAPQVKEKLDKIRAGI